MYTHNLHVAYNKKLEFKNLLTAFANKKIQKKKQKIVLMCG